MKAFLKEFNNKKNIKTYTKEGLEDLIISSQDDVISVYIKKGFKDMKIKDSIFDVLENKFFIKGMKSLVKSDIDVINTTWVIIISEFLGYRIEKLDEEMVDTYDKLVDKILKKQIKKMVSKTGVDKDVARELLVVAPSKKLSENSRVTNIYVNKVLRKLYMIVKEDDMNVDSDTIKAIMKFLFDKSVLGDVAISILLEKKSAISTFNENQLRAWNELTSYALSVLEKKKTDTEELLIKYMDIRKNAAKANRDGARRINLTQLPKEDYKRIFKAVKKIGLED